MTTTVNFAVGPPPAVAHLEKVDDQIQYTPNPQFSQWINRMWQWSVTFGNNANNSIGGFKIGATTITDIAGTMGMSSAVTGGDDIRFWAGSSTPSSAPFYVTEAGVLTATSGTIAGWTLGTTTISKNNAILDSAGQLALGTANNVVFLSATDATYRLWVGNAAAASAAFSVTREGDIASSGSAIFTGASSTSVAPPGGSANTTIYVNGAKHGIGAISSGVYTAVYAETSGASASGSSFYATNSSTGTASNWPVHAVSKTATVEAIQATAFGAGNAIASSGPIKITATTAPALDIWNTPVGASKFSVDGNNGNTLIAGTLGVTGAITGSLTGNASGTAATVTGAAQTAITSLGTLTGLTMAGNVNSGTAWTHDIGAPNPFATVYALKSYAYSLVLAEDTTGTIYNDSTNLAQISNHQTHNLAAAKYKLGSVPGTGTAPFMYFNIGGKVCLFVDATGAGTAC